MIPASILALLLLCGCQKNVELRPPIRTAHYFVLEVEPGRYFVLLTNERYREEVEKRINCKPCVIERIGEAWWLIAPN